MNTLKTEGIILISKPFFEKDRMVDILTPEQGKMRLLAKGANSPKKNSFSALQPTLHARFSLSPTKSFTFVNGTDALHSFPGIRDSFNKISLACYFLEIARKSTVYHQSHTRLFSLLLEVLLKLELGEDILDKLLELKTHFQTQFLIAEGLLEENSPISDYSFKKSVESYCSQVILSPVFLT